MSQWKRQLLDGASELFTRGKQSKDKEKGQAKEEGQAKEAELFQQIGRLQMELEWLKKSLSCSDARELRKLVDHDHPELSVSRQCALLGHPRSTLHYQPTPVGMRSLSRWSREASSPGGGAVSSSVVDKEAAGRHAKGSARSIEFLTFSLAAGLIFGDDHYRIPCSCRQRPAPQACAKCSGRQA